VSTYTLIIPGDPVPKGRPRLVNGRVYTPPRTKEAEKAIWAYAAAKKIKPLDGPIKVTIHFTLRPHANGRPRKVDLDNLVKLVLDALNGKAWHDDSQIYEITASKRDLPHPSTLIRIDPL
jgi:Holliday junction resolvase RusA-like endonuclease